MVDKDINVLLLAINTLSTQPAELYMSNYMTQELQESAKIWFLSLQPDSCENIEYADHHSAVETFGTGLEWLKMT